jgi:hypothetical protein
MKALSVRQLVKRAIEESALNARREGRRCDCIFISDKMYWSLGKLLTYASDNTYRLSSVVFVGPVLVDGLLPGNACYFRSWS